ncbi:MAG: lysylphosphatidylglycerol synthase transmembrane domain-containing protein, partial [Candidatus Nanopelagicales bacterium]
AIPRYRAAFRDQASTAQSALLVLRHPGKVAGILGGNLGGQVVQAIVLGICLGAFDESASLSQLILVNTIVSLFAGMMPVPGGVGVAEAGYAYGLQAIGVPAPIAVSTSIAFRVVTFYLPPLWCSQAMRWLRRQGCV